jgi:hypothetical protein
MLLTQPPTPFTAVIIRLDRMIQYSEMSVMETKHRCVLDPRWSLSSGAPKARPGGGDGG